MKNVFIMTILLLAMCSYAFQPVDVNNASVEQLALLPGVGKKLAQNIARARSRARFISVAALRNVDGMTESKFEALRAHITLKPSLSLPAPNLPPPKTFSVTKPLIPNLTSLELEVIRAQDLASDRETSLHNRVRKAAWLPKLSAAIDFGQINAATQKLIDDRNDSTLVRKGGDVSFGIRATFELDKLLYNDEELAVATFALKRLEKREQVIARLHELYFRYVKLAERAELPNDASTLQTITDEMRETRAMLDSLSDGWFSRTQGKR